VARYCRSFLDELDRLERAPLPAGATRSERDGYLVFDFTGAGATPGGAAAAFESWLIELDIELARHANDNAQGDPMVDWSASVTKAPERSGVSLYDRFGHTAYLADARDGRSITRPEKLKALQQIKRAGALPTGEPVQKVMLVVPSRDDAVALYGMVERGDVDAVVYPDEYLHDPNTLGESRWVPWPDLGKAKTKQAAAKKPSKKKPAKKKPSKKKPAKKKPSKKKPAKKKPAKKNS
jgi:cell division septation protein DedD